MAASTQPTFDILKANFDAAYSGNRAPMPLYIHTPWLLAGDHTSGLQRFIGGCRGVGVPPRWAGGNAHQRLALHLHLARSRAALLCYQPLPLSRLPDPIPARRPADYVLRLPDAHFVTMRQLLDWMQHPAAADQLTPEALGCGNPGGAGPARKADDSGGGKLPVVKPQPQPEPQQPAASPSPPPPKRKPQQAPKPKPKPKPSPSPDGAEARPEAAAASPPPVSPASALPDQTRGQLACPLG